MKTKRSGIDLLTTRGGRHTCLEWRENHTSNWFYLTRCEHVLWNPFERTAVLKTAALPRKESGDTHQNTRLSVFHTRTRHEKLLFMCFLLCVCVCTDCISSCSWRRSCIVARLAALRLSVYLCVECVYPPRVRLCTRVWLLSLEPLCSPRPRVIRQMKRSAL